jgi:hypothetical protein
VHKNALAKAELRKHAPATPAPREKS